MTNGTADVPYISNFERRLGKTIRFVKIMNATGVLQYVLLRGRKGILADLLTRVYLGDPWLAKKKCKKALDQRHKSWGSLRS